MQNSQWPLSFFVLLSTFILSWFGLIGLIAHAISLFFREKPQSSDYYAPAFAVGVIVMNIVGILYMRSTRNDWLAHRRTASGVITASGINELTSTREISDGDNRLTKTDYNYAICIKYTFSAGELPETPVLTGTAKLDDNYSSSEAAQARLAADFAIGKTVTVYYDERDHTRNMVTEFPRDGRTISFVSLFLVVAIYSLYVPAFFAFVRWLSNKTPPMT